MPSLQRATAHKGPTSKCFKNLHPPTHTEVSLHPRAGALQALSFPSYNSFSFWKDVCDALETDSTEIPLLCKESQKVSEIGVCLLRNQTKPDHRLSCFL